VTAASTEVLSIQAGNVRNGLRVPSPRRRRPRQTRLTSTCRAPIFANSPALWDASATSALPDAAWDRQPQARIPECSPA